MGSHSNRALTFSGPNAAIGQVLAANSVNNLKPSKTALLLEEINLSSKTTALKKQIQDPSRV